MSVNEVYEISVHSNWGTLRKEIKSCDLVEGETIKVEFILRKRPNIEHGDIVINVDNKKYGSPVEYEESTLSKQENHNHRIIIAYARLDDDEWDDYKSVTIFRDNNEQVLYSGVVEHDASLYNSLREIPIQIGNKTFINLRNEYGKFIEVSVSGVRENLDAESIHRGNFYHRHEDITGFVYVDGRLKSLKTSKVYDDIRGNFLLNLPEKWDSTYYVYDRDSEDILHSGTSISGSLMDRIRYQHWLPFYIEEGILLVNRYAYFRLDENEFPVDKAMYTIDYKEYYENWLYASDNRILTTYSNDEYLPDYNSIKTIFMRDENGKIIKTISAEGLFLKRNFHYNRCLAIKKRKRIVVFIDEDGNINEIPNTEVSGEPEYVDCFFINKNVLVVCDEGGATMLTTKGEVIFQCWDMYDLSGGLVKFHSENGYGVVDATGSIIIPAGEYEDFNVLF